MDYRIRTLTGWERRFYIFIRDSEDGRTLDELYIFYGKDDAYARRILRRLMLKGLINKYMLKSNKRKRLYKVKTYIE